MDKKYTVRKLLKIAKNILSDTINEDDYDISIKQFKNDVRKNINIDKIREDKKD